MTPQILLMKGILKEQPWGVVWDFGYVEEKTENSVRRGGVYEEGDQRCWTIRGFWKHQPLLKHHYEDI